MLTPTSNENLQQLADNATQLAKIIRTWLPVRGDADSKTGSQRTAEHWFYRAAEHYMICERIRNPRKMAFGHRGGSYFGPSECSPAWFELELALDEIAVAYGLQSVSGFNHWPEKDIQYLPSDEQGIPHLPYEQDVPAIEADTLRRLELAAAAIIESLLAEPAAVAESPDKPGPEFTKRADARAEYFKVWAFVSKPGNAAKTNAEIANATQVNKDMVSRILTETRPPTSAELGQMRNEGKKR